LSKHEVRQHDVPHGGERAAATAAQEVSSFPQKVGGEAEAEGSLPPNIVKGDAYLLETEVVEGDHSNEDDGEGESLEGHLQLDRKVGKGFEEGMEGAQKGQRPACRDSDQALKPGHKKGRIEPQIRRREEILVEEHHRDGNHPIQGNHQGDLDQSV